MSEKEGLELENISNEVDRLEIEADNEALTSVQGMTLLTKIVPSLFFLFYSYFSIFICLFHN